MSSKTTVTKAAGIMMAAIMLSRVLGLVRDMVISGLFGQGRNTDIYYAAFSVPDLLFYLIAGGAISSAFVPIFVEHISNGRKQEAWKLFSILATTMFLVIAAVVVVGEIFTRQLIPIIAAPGFKGPELDQVAHLTRIVLPSQLFFLLGALMMGSLWAHNHYKAPGLGPSIYNIGIITGGAIAGHKFGPQGIQGLAWGALAGAFLGNFVLQYFVLRRYGLKFKPSLNVKHPDAIKVWKLMIPVIFSLSLPQIDVWINRRFATYFFGGAVSAIERSNRLMQVPIGIFGQAIAIGFFATMAAQYATGKMDDYRETVNFGIRSILFVSIPATVLMIVLRMPIIQLFFQHGEFTAQNSIDVAKPLVFYALGIAAWSTQAIIARAFYSIQDTKTPVWTGTVMTAIFIPMNYCLMRIMGYTGLALATTIAATMHSLTMFFLLRKKAGGIDARRIFISTAKITAASLLMGAAMWFVLGAIGHHIPSGLPHKVSSGLKLLGPMVVGFTIFFIMAKVFKLDELAVVLNMIKSKFFKQSKQAA